jgi:hypothetical protein
MNRPSLPLTFPTLFAFHEYVLHKRQRASHNTAHDSPERRHNPRTSSTRTPHRVSCTSNKTPSSSTHTSATPLPAPVSSGRPASFLVRLGCALGGSGGQSDAILALCRVGARWTFRRGMFGVASLCFSGWVERPVQGVWATWLRE